MQNIPSHWDATIAVKKIIIFSFLFFFLVHISNLKPNLDHLQIRLGHSIKLIRWWLIIIMQKKKKNHSIVSDRCLLIPFCLLLSFCIRRWWCRCSDTRYIVSILNSKRFIILINWFVNCMLPTPKRRPYNNVYKLDTFETVICHLLSQVWSKQPCSTCASVKSEIRHLRALAELWALK